VLASRVLTTDDLTLNYQVFALRFRAQENWDDVELRGHSHQNGSADIYMDWVGIVSADVPLAATDVQISDAHTTDTVIQDSHTTGTAISPDHTTLASLAASTGGYSTPINYKGYTSERQITVLAGDVHPLIHSFTAPNYDTIGFAYAGAKMIGGDNMWDGAIRLWAYRADTNETLALAMFSGYDWGNGRIQEWSITFPVPANVTIKVALYFYSFDAWDQDFQWQKVAHYILQHTHGFTAQPSGHPVSTQPSGHPVTTQPSGHPKTEVGHTH